MMDLITKFLENKKPVLFLVLAGVTTISVLIYWFISDPEIDRKNLNKGFAGKVTYISYDIKQFPTVTIGDSSYYIGSGYNTDHQIEEGDSLEKKRGSSSYKLIKYKSHKIVEFTK